MPADGYRCPSCGMQFLQAGYCATCRRERKSYVRLQPIDATRIVCLGEMVSLPLRRVPFPGWPAITAALNGGLPAGKLLMVSGAPGIGKSTLALGLVSGVDGALYLSSEQEAADLREIGARCGYSCDGVLFSAQSSIRGVEEAVEEAKPAIVVLDSIQRIALETGLVETVTRLITLAQAHAAPMLLTCQVIKDDTWAGPRAVEHLVDGMAELRSGCVCFPDGKIVSTEEYHPASACPVPGIIFEVVGKYRYGPVGRVARLRRLASGRIEELDNGGS